MIIDADNALSPKRLVRMSVSSAPARPASAWRCSSPAPTLSAAARIRRSRAGRGNAGPLRRRWPTSACTVRPIATGSGVLAAPRRFGAAAACPSTRSISSLATTAAQRLADRDAACCRSTPKRTGCARRATLLRGRVLERRAADDRGLRSVPFQQRHFGALQLPDGFRRALWIACAPPPISSVLLHANVTAVNLRPSGDCVAGR